MSKNGPFIIVLFGIVKETGRNENFGEFDSRKISIYATTINNNFENVTSRF